MLEFSIKKQLSSFSLEVSFQMKERTLALLGPSGSGKTLCLNALAGFEDPDEGEILWKKQKFFSSSKQIRMKPEKRKIGYVMQAPSLFPHLSVQKNLLYGHCKDSKGPGWEEVLKVLKLEAFLSRKPDGLSGGEKERVAIGRALLSGPELLLLDEPVSSLDREAKWEVLSYIKAVQETFHLPMIYVTHAPEEMEFLAQEVILLRQGRVAAAGTKEEVSHSQEIFNSSFAQGFNNLLEVEMVSSDSEKGISIVWIQGKEFRTPLCLHAKPGTRLYMMIPSDEIILSREHPSALSAQNIYCGEVKDIIETKTADIVIIDSGFELFAQITKASRKRLSIVRGEKIHYLFKTPATRLLGDGH